MMRIATLLSLYIALSTGICICVTPLAQVFSRKQIVTFKPMDVIEQHYIYRSLGSQEIPSEHTRFQDKTAYIIYRFAFGDSTGASISMHLSAQFLVEISPDGVQYAKVADYKHNSGTLLNIELSKYISRTGKVYVRIGDAKPDDGWGGKIHSVTVRGFVVDPHNERIANAKPEFLHDRSQRSLYAALPVPERHLYHFNPYRPTPAESILFRSLQGLVNRNKNELMVEDTWDSIPELQKKRWIDECTVIPNTEALFARYPLHDAVVYNPDLYGSENLAVMIGAMRGLVVAHPALVGRYHLNVIEDLRNKKWKTTLDGYKEIYVKYRKQFNRKTLVMAAPSKRPDLYDYAVANKTFTFWIVGGTDADRKGADRWAEEEWFERMLTTDFPVNIPILGYPQVEPEDGIGENRGVELFSRCGKFLIPADHMPNLSVLSAYPNARGKITVPIPTQMELTKDGIYASMVLSDGDNLCLWNGPKSFMFKYMDSMKSSGPRQFAVSYTMGPSMVDLNPLTASLINDHLEPQDTIGGAVSGVGYMYMAQYANNFGNDRKRVVDDFIELTSRYLGYAGERWDWIMDYGGPGSARIKDYKYLVGCKALMGGYGQETSDPTKTAEDLGGGLYAFHSISRMVDMTGVLEDVHKITGSKVRPLFLNIFISNWSVNADHYRQLADELGAEGIKIVNPETLADLYGRSLAKATQ